MAFKFVVFLASLAVASAGYLEAPATYAHAPLAYNTLSHAAPLAYNSYHAAPLAYSSYSHAPVAYAGHTSYATPAIGASHETTIRGHDATVSHHSKAVDTAFSSVRKSDTRVTNEAPKLAYTSYAHAPAVHATYAHAAPAVHATYAAPALSYSHAPALSYSHAPALSYGHAAPALSIARSYPTALSYPRSYAAPALTTYAAHAPALATHTAVAHVDYHGSHAHYAF